MILRILSVVFGSIALGLFAVTGYLQFQPPLAHAPELEVQEPTRVLKNVVVGREYEVAFRVVNRGGESRRIIGFEGH